MNTYELITQKIKQWARDNDDIRAVIIIGSRARSHNEPADKYSDLDLLLIVNC